MGFVPTASLDRCYGNPEPSRPAWIPQHKSILMHGWCRFITAPLMYLSIDACADGFTSIAPSDRPPVGRCRGPTGATL